MINRTWCKDLINFDQLSDALYVNKPTIGIVVGTFASVPYIHLQLESRLRHYQDTPILIHDDGSNKSSELQKLCLQYGADYEYNTVRQPHCIGDLTAFAGGLLWAKSKSIDILVKISRRWLFRVDFINDLQKLALNSQYATFCSYTTTFNFGFRTECVAMNVAQWSRPGSFEQIIEPIRTPREIFVEGHLHNIARSLEKQNCARAKHYRTTHPTTPERNGYAFWSLMGNDRMRKSSNYLWHDANSTADYAQQATQWSLPYSVNDFVDPNGGQGIGNPAK